SDIVRALVRHEVADQVAAGAGNELAPALCVLAKGIELERVDLVADETSDRHGCSRTHESEQYRVRTPRWFEEHRTMTDGSSMVAAATLIGDYARAKMLTALMGGRALTATELAGAAGITKQTGSTH